MSSVNISVRFNIVVFIHHNIVISAVCNLSYYSAGMTRMVADGIIPSIVQLVLAKDIVTVHYSCAALCRLCCTVENSKLILESDAVPNLVLGAKEGKFYCCFVSIDSINIIAVYILQYFISIKLIFVFI